MLVDKEEHIVTGARTAEGSFKCYWNKRGKNFINALSARFCDLLGMKLSGLGAPQGPGWAWDGTRGGLFGTVAEGIPERVSVKRSSGCIGTEAGGHREHPEVALEGTDGVQPWVLSVLWLEAAPETVERGFSSGPSPLLLPSSFQTLSPTVTEQGHPQGRGGEEGRVERESPRETVVFPGNPWAIELRWCPVPLMLKRWTEPSFWSMGKNKFYLICWI